MNLYDLIMSRRTIREFDEKPVSPELLEKFADAARLAPQAANKQSLEYILVNDKEACDKIFSNVVLAGYLNWKPAKEKQPRAYIAIIVKEGIQKPIWIPYDVAYASHNICLAALTEGIASCLIGAFNKSAVKTILKLPENYDVPLLVALGFPAHKSVVEKMNDNDSKYWRDADGTFHVPKRSLNSIIHINEF